MRPPVKVRNKWKASKVEKVRWVIGDVLIRLAGWVYPQ